MFTIKASLMSPYIIYLLLFFNSVDCFIKYVFKLRNLSIFFLYAIEKGKTLLNKNDVKEVWIKSNIFIKKKCLLVAKD